MIITRAGVWFAMLLLLAGTDAVLAQYDTCSPCPIPCARTQDDFFSLRLKGGRTDPPHRFIGITRDTTVVAGESVQGYRLFWVDDSGCRDTVVQAAHAEALVMGITLGKVPPMYVPVLPVREYAMVKEPTANYSWAEIGAFLAYAGSDESEERPEQIGIDNLYFGADVMVAPFGDLLGEHLSLGLGVGITSEGGRLRVPALAQLRYTFTSTSIKTAVRYEPDHCQFMCPGETADSVVVPDGYEQRPGPDSVDPSVVLLRERIAERDAFAPYLFLEGGWIFDTGFEGSGADPSENPEDYAQYLGGIGGGLPITDAIHVQLAYRFMRLNLRTPCENCPDLWQVNTNLVHSALLRVAYHIGW